SALALKLKLSAAWAANRAKPSSAQNSIEPERVAKGVRGIISSLLALLSDFVIEESGANVRDHSFNRKSDQYMVLMSRRFCSLGKAAIKHAWCLVSDFGLKLQIYIHIALFPPHK
ncbi:MAG: hypothetical protein ACREP5_00815, partial [Candidatus Binatia bacterium]